MPTEFYHTSEKHFRRYEEHLCQIVDNWPRPTIFQPQSPVRSVNTLASHLRLARQAINDNLDSNGWVTSFNIKKWWDITSLLIISTKVDLGSVWCGPRSAIDALAVSPMPTIVPSQIVGTVNDPPQAVLDAILLLHEKNVLIDPTVVQTSLDVESLAAFYDVAVTKDGNRYTIL
jgi:hypothetical protein